MVREWSGSQGAVGGVLTASIVRSHPEVPATRGAFQMPIRRRHGGPSEKQMGWCACIHPCAAIRGESESPMFIRARPVRVVAVSQGRRGQSGSLGPVRVVAVSQIAPGSSEGDRLQVCGYGYGCRRGQHRVPGITRRIRCEARLTSKFLNSIRCRLCGTTRKGGGGGVKKK